MKTNKGFTLIELLVVVTIIGILSAIAVPAYNDYVIRGRLAEGMSALSDGRVKMEQYFQDNRTYVAATPASNGCPSATIPVPLTPPSGSTFSYGCSNLAAATYTLTATGNGRVLGFVMTINETNTKRTTAAPAGWAAAAMPTSCWITKKAGKC